jgi:hypothetical protein
MMTDKTLQAEIEELMAMHNMIETAVFQKFLAKPMKEERDKLRTAFFSDTLKESWRKGGKQEGLQVFMKLIENIHLDLKNKLQELEDSKGER